MAIALTLAAVVILYVFFAGTTVENPCEFDLADEKE
jgi:hypothetical protein